MAWTTKPLLASLFTLTVLSCSNPKAANKANFKKAIQTALDQRPECLSVGLPSEPRDFMGHPATADPEGEALVAAGLASKRRLMVSNPGSTLFGGPKEVPGIHYDWTAEGRKYIGHSQHAFTVAGSTTVCYGTPEVLNIIRYSEPGSAMEQTIRTSPTHTC